MARRQPGQPRRVGDSPAFKWSLIVFVVVTSLIVIVSPLVVIATEALGRGLPAYFAAIAEPDMVSAVTLTVVVALIAVPINTLFGIAAAWAVTKFDFPGRRLLIIVIDIPFSVSPIVAGVSYLFVYGLQGLFGPTLQSADIKILFALPGIVMASMFVTAPFVARELIPLMQAQGRDLEEAATSLGASGFRTFMSVTLPNVRWAMLYGIILCNARVMGEFGAVSVVSGNIRGETNTLPLHVELLYHDYQTAASFAAASILAFLAVLTLIAKVWLERQGAGRAGRPSLSGPPVPAPVMEKA
ncbi:sulfate ABC transporter permease subunit CysW [Mesorhizobium sp. RP14(2022)]|uniref:Sulfate ABC transporter permease subunit CysW n=1 Tax=Mesorhizobium liriopis TaxID=2953882 RepID=A0ABT1C4Q5_9HYPH|nr:sulfate ABC transporter permease subunit CysW [Mesorhizobium liriopis]MCO6049812.1 sulfate ABC transporter permease subunit CysW [Mesorhizobium liriopis]